MDGSLALLTDLYELTMAYGYWKTGMTGREAVFHLFFRHNPFDSGFTIACGLAPVLDFLERFQFTAGDLDYLATLRGEDHRPLFEPDFLKMLGRLRIDCAIDAVPEGTVIFPQEPLLRVRGPILQAQLLETALLNILNFQSLIATKAARICLAAGGDPVLEFGLRRAQGPDGGISASRASFVGGCAATSNVLAGKLFGIPVGGTHAHSWVMAFDDELESFKAYAEAMPNNCVFLVDTYNSLQGVRHAIEVGNWLRANGHKLIGIRLDSGDLAYLSSEARGLLDAAGFTDARIYASNELDEDVIRSLKEQHARIGVWGVGTHLATAYGQPALGGVYKLSALRQPGEPWQHKIKLSEQAAKISTPGVQQVRRFSRAGEFLGDMIFDESLTPAATLSETGSAGRTIIDPLDATRRKQFPAEASGEDLLVPVWQDGRRVYQSPPLTAIRARAQEQLRHLHAGVKRFVNPHQYPVGLETNLMELRTNLILEARGLRAGRASEAPGG